MCFLYQESGNMKTTIFCFKLSHSIFRLYNIKNSNPDFDFQIFIIKNSPKCNKSMTCFFFLLLQNALNPFNQYKSYFFHIENTQSKLIHI